MTIDDHAPPPPDEVDLDKPSAARIYDWYLGGDSNYAVDREFGKKAVEKFPPIRPMARSNRNWLARVVRSALDAGITQFLDVGSGIPTVGNVHQMVADALGPGNGRVVYVDSEPVAAAHARLILEREGADGWAGVVQEDLRHPQAIVDNPTTQQLLDLSQPVCVLLVSVLHFIGGADNVPGVIAGYRDQLASGSWLALSHITVDDTRPSKPPSWKRCARPTRTPKTPPGSATATKSPPGSPASSSSNPAWCT